MFGRVQAQFERDKELREEKRKDALAEINLMTKHGSGVLSQEYIKELAGRSGISETGLQSMMHGKVVIPPKVEPISAGEYDKRFGQPSEHVQQYIPSETQREIAAGREKGFATEALTQELHPAQEARRVESLQATTDVATKAGKDLLDREYKLKTGLEKIKAKYDKGTVAKQEYYDYLKEAAAEKAINARNKTTIDKFNKVVSNSADVGIMGRDKKGKIIPTPVKKGSPEYEAHKRYWTNSGIGYEEMPTKDPRFMRFTEEYVEIAPVLGKLETGAKMETMGKPQKSAVEVTGFDEKFGMVKINEGGKTRAIKAERVDGGWTFKVSGKSYRLKGNK